MIMKANKKEGSGQCPYRRSERQNSATQGGVREDLELKVVKRELG